MSRTARARAERLVRNSGFAVRPRWFEYNDPQQQQPVLLQGDRRQTVAPHDGVDSCRLIARVVVASLVSKAAERRAFEFVAETGPKPDELDAFFTSTDNDVAGKLVDLQNMPSNDEPLSVVSDLTRAEEWTANENYDAK